MWVCTYNGILFNFQKEIKEILKCEKTWTNPGKYYAR